MVHNRHQLNNRHHDRRNDSTRVNNQRRQHPSTPPTGDFMRMYDTGEYSSYSTGNQDSTHDTRDTRETPGTSSTTHTNRHTPKRQGAVRPICHRNKRNQEHHQEPHQHTCALLQQAGVWSNSSNKEDLARLGRSSMRCSCII